MLCGGLAVQTSVPADRGRSEMTMCEQRSRVELAGNRSCRVEHVRRDRDILRARQVNCCQESAGPRLGATFFVGACLLQGLRRRRKRLLQLAGQ